MHLKPEELRIVKRLLQEYVPGHEVWVFGSRAHGRHLKPFSDLDLAIMTDSPLSLDAFVRLKHAFTESDLPFRVDVVDWAATEPHFKDIIAKEHSVIL